MFPLVIPEMVAALPGLREVLQQFVGCELVATARWIRGSGGFTDRPAAARGR